MCFNFVNHSRRNSQHNQGGPEWPFDNSENLHSENNKQDIHPSSKNYEEDGYGHNLNLLIISHEFCVFHTYEWVQRGKSLLKAPLRYRCNTWINHNNWPCLAIHYLRGTQPWFLLQLVSEPSWRLRELHSIHRARLSGLDPQQMQSPQLGHHSQILDSCSQASLQARLWGRI